MLNYLSSALLAFITLSVAQSSAQTRIHSAFLVIDTSNNASYNQVHWLVGMPYLSIKASNDHNYQLHSIASEGYVFTGICLSTGGLPFFRWGSPIIQRGSPIFQRGSPIFQVGVAHYSEGVSNFSKGVSHFSEVGVSHFSERSPIIHRGYPIIQRGLPFFRGGGCPFFRRGVSHFVRGGRSPIFSKTGDHPAPPPHYRYTVNVWSIRILLE